MLTYGTDDDWQQQYGQERARLLAVLGKLTDGGIVDNVQHIGATSVPGVCAQPCIDIGLSVWPFPLEPHRRAALESLGCEMLPGHDDAPEQRLRHKSGEFQLFVVDQGSELWVDYLIIRGYLRHDQGARPLYSAFKQEWASRALTDPAAYRQAKEDRFLRTLPEARQWWVDSTGFAPVQAVAEELEEFGRPWYISSGWALDLFLGRVTRVHGDVDVSLARTNQLALQQHLTTRGWKFMTPLKERLAPWPLHMSLELPRHQAHAHRDGSFIDFLMSDIEHGVWRYRRQPSVICTVERLSLQTHQGIPFLAPEIVLLFKSKNTGHKDRNKDQIDFERVYTLLESEGRAWLRWALIACDPTHPWIARLT